MRKLDQSILSGQNIGAGYTLIHTYTGTAEIELFARCLIDNIEVTGSSADYSIYASLQSLGSGSFHVGVPMTTASLPSGTSESIFFTTLPIPVESGDVFRVYVKSEQPSDNSAYIKTTIHEASDEIIEGTLGWREIKRLIMAVLFGKSTGGGTTSVAFRDNADSKDRVSATVDSDGNRTSVSLDGA